MAIVAELVEEEEGEAGVRATEVGGKGVLMTGVAACDEVAYAEAAKEAVGADERGVSLEGGLHGGKVA